MHLYEYNHISYRILSFVSYLRIYNTQTSKFGDRTKEKLRRCPIVTPPVGANIVTLGSRWPIQGTDGFCCNCTGHIPPRSVEKVQLTAIATILKHIRYLGSPIIYRNSSCRRCHTKGSEKGFLYLLCFAGIYKGWCRCERNVLMLVINEKWFNSFLCWTNNKNKL